MTELEDVAKLKEKGNTLFVRKDYASASVLYTKAIAIDASNAVLYANRSACRLAMKQYLDAKSDAVKAIEVDPKYPKGWSRLANAHDALGEWLESADAYRHALDALPKENLTATEAKQKEQYQAAIQAAIKAAIPPDAPPNAFSHDRSSTGVDKEIRMPWEIADSMIPDLMAVQNVNSCAWVLHCANQDFKSGVATMQAIEAKVHNGVTSLKGDTGGLMLITEAIIRDPRIFRIEGAGWLEAYNHQLTLEIKFAKPWLTEGPEDVKEDAIARQRKDGWDSVRPRLSTTLRLWMMRAFMDMNIKNNHLAAVEYYGRVVEILTWGRTVWKDVPRTSRGAIFEDTFLRGVRSLYIDALLGAYQKDQSNTQLLEDLYEEANAIIRDLKANPYNRRAYPGLDAGAQWSFFSYCLGNALAAKGFYHCHMGELLDNSDAEAQFRLAGEFYFEAARQYCVDDANYPWFLKCGLQYVAPFGMPARTALAKMKQIRDSLPGVRKIWGPTNDKRYPGREKTYAEVLKQEQKLLKRVEAGHLTLDDIVTPEIPL